MDNIMKENILQNLDENLNFIFTYHDSDTSSHELFLLVKELVSKGNKREDILQILGKYREKFQDENRERDEDHVIGMMDRLVGWCDSSDRI
jgi:hypothetical protein